MARKNEDKDIETMEGHKNIYIHIKKSTIYAIFVIASFISAWIIGLTTFILFFWLIPPNSGVLADRILTKIALVLGLASLTGWAVKLTLWLNKKLDEC